MNRRRVLCAIEDDPDMRFLIRATLRTDSRLDVLHEADNLDDALKAIGSDPPDLAIIDHFIHGTVMGLQAAPILKQVAPTMKILLFTSHELSIEASREPAIDRYLKKGEIEELLATVQVLLGLGNAFTE